MENKNNKLKRFHVTQSLRFGSTGVKLLFYAGVLLETAAVASICYCIGSGSKGLLGVGVICAVLAAIWIIAVHMMSDNNYGLATVAFHEKGIVYKANGAAETPEHLFRWDDCVECGIEKTRLSFWVYCSDHKLENSERKEFPENVKDGVFYFNYAYNTWEEFMKFVPERFKAQLETEWREKKVK